MSQRICTAEHLLSTTAGVDFTDSWFPRVVLERRATSSRDGTVDRSPDPVPFIDSDMLWTNDTGTTQHATVHIRRATRFLLSSMFNTLALDDAWSFDVGTAPAAPTPAAAVAGVGVRITNARSFEKLSYRGQVFKFWPDYVSYVEIGTVPAGHTVNFRYRCLFSTPGNWRVSPSPRYEANAYYTDLKLWASPMLTGSV